jgi:hypothetical protein
LQGGFQAAPAPQDMKFYLILMSNAPDGTPGTGHPDGKKGVPKILLKDAKHKYLGSSLAYGL